MLHPDFGAGAKRVLKAIGRSLAIIEFDPKGKIISANENFCRCSAIGGRNRRPAPQPVRRARTTRAAPNTGNSGPSSAAANSTRANTSASARADGSLDPGLLQSGDRREGQSAQSRQGRDRHHRREAAERRKRGQAQRDLARAGDHRIHARRRRSSRPTRISSTCSAIGSRRSRASIIACSSSRPMRSRPNTRSSGAS